MSHFSVLVIGDSQTQKLEQLEQYYEPEEINPDGSTNETRNPDSKWDWYEIGGRWAGSLKHKADIAGESELPPPPNFSWGWSEEDQQKILAENGCDVDRLCNIANIAEISTFAVIKDGKWYEKGEMGWLGIISNQTETDDDWTKNFHERFLKNLEPDTIITVVDCHI
jgi:hypothetical protein